MRYVYLAVYFRDAMLTLQALDQLKLPIDVVEGHLGQLVLQIPWSNLKNKPVKVLIEDVFLLAVPKLNQDYDDEEQQRRNQAVKLSRLDDLEIADKMSTSANLSPEEIRKNQSFTDSLVTKIIDNLQITIKNIHIRYEDHTSVPNHSFSLGISLEELSAISTNSEWDPIFIQDTASITHKLTTLSSLSIYWNTDSKFIKDDELPEILRFMSLVPGLKENVTDSFQYILRPVSGLGRITINKAATGGPKTKAELMFDELGFVFDSDQYRDVLWVVEVFRIYNRTKEFHKFRPKTTVKENPKAWLKYAADVVLAEVKQKRREWTWDYILERRTDKIRYIQLYKQKTIAPPLSVEETEEFNNLEIKYNFDDLRFYRSLAKSELKKEKAQVKAAHVPKLVDNSWSSWLWGSSAKPDTSDAVASDAETLDSVTITDEQRQELYDAIEWDEKQAVTDSIDVPRDMVTLEVEATLKTGSFKLRQNPHNNPEDIVQILFTGLSSSFYNRPDSYLVNVSLDELRVDDGNNVSLYKQVVTVKSLPPSTLPQSENEDGSSEPESENASEKDSFFWMSFESNPLDDIADSNLFIKMKSITVFYNTLFFENVMRFFHPPKIHLETLSAILNAANATVEELRDQTRIGLEYALQEHKTVNLKLDMQAPLIVMPLDVTSWSSPCAIIDAGHISVVSHLVGREVIEEVKKKKTLQYTDGDWKRLESLMYDKFNLKLHNTQFLIGSNVRDTMKQLHNSISGTTASVLDRINLDFLVEISILPDAQSLTKFKISGTLPLFQASMSDAKYKIMMQLIDKGIPNFSFDELTESDELSLVESNENIVLARNRTDQVLSEYIHDDSASEISVKTEPSSASVRVSTQKIFEFNFKVERVKMALHRCKSIETLAQDPIVDMVLESFEIYYYYKDKEMMADVVVQNVSIEDYTQNDVPIELTKLATSVCNSNLDSDFFKVKYKRIKTDHFDRFGQQISDQEVAVNMSAMKYVISPKTFLTILDFIITTFTNPQTQQLPPTRSTADGTLTPEGELESVAKIDVKVNLNSITILLNDDGIKIATLQLDSALVNVFLVPEKMKVEARVGRLSLYDEVNEGSSRNSILRQLISIEGSDLADFKYETYDPNSSDFHYNSVVYLRAASMKFNVVEEPFSRIVKFMSKFVQMKALYDSARQAAVTQASQIQVEDANKIHFDILVSTPIVIIPKLVEFSDDGLCDMIVAHLGEIYAKNEYVHFPEDPEGPTANHISVGIRAIKMSSNFNFPDRTSQYLEMIDKLDLALDLSFVQPYETMTRPVTLINGYLSDTSMKFTEMQYKFLMEASSIISTIFGGEPGIQEQELDQLEEELRVQKNLEPVAVIRVPELPPAPANISKLDVSFHAKKVELDLYNKTENVMIDDLENCRLTKFSLNDAGFKLRMKQNSDMESDIHIKSFTVHDTRSVKENKFTEIIPFANHEEYQFMCNFTMTGQEKRKLKAMLTVDSPSIILAIDYLFALKEFFFYGSVNSSEPIPELEEEYYEDESESEFSEDEPPLLPARPVSVSSQNNLAFEYHVNIVDASVILLANPKFEDSEAIVFKAEHFILSQQETMVLSANKVGMFLCRMNNFEKNRLRLLDDFSLTATMDSRGSSPNSEICKINISCEPLVLRLALRDVMLALDIVKRASNLFSQLETPTENAPNFKKTIKYSRFSKFQKSRVSTVLNSYPTSFGGRSRSSLKSRRNSASAARVTVPIIRGQTLLAEFEGLRCVLIGNIHELPMLDMCTKPFKVKVRNWSSDLTIDSGIETFVNIFNYEKSAWEPLIEPWDLGLHVARSIENNNTAVNLYSRRMAEITVTAQTISIIGSVMKFLAEDAEEFLSQSTGLIAPYRIVNQTGYDIEIWIDHPDRDEIKNSTIIADGEEIPWRFHAWNIVRENLSTDTQKVNLGVFLKDSTFDPVRNISLTSVGEHIYTLYPKADTVSHRLMCEVVMDESVKRIVLRSALTFENKTQIPIDIAIGPTNNESFMCRINPGQSRAIPIEHAYDKAVSIRPDPSFKFGWSREPMYWKNMLTGPKSISCLPLNESSSTKFYFQATAIYDKSIPLTRIYPHMKIVLSPPVEITNLLPFDFTYRIYDKNTNQDWGNILKQGATGAVHVVELSHLLLLNIHPKEAGYNCSDFAIINTPKKDFALEHGLVTRSTDGQRLVLKLHYIDKMTNNGGCKVQVYTPYLILNKTGLDIKVQTKFNTAISKVYSVSQHHNGKETFMKIASPKMWSFDSDDRGNRATICVGDSKWSEPLSFDTLGKDSDVTICSSTRQSEIHIGLHISEGLGKYQLTKIVTFTPRFIVNNKLPNDLQIKDPSSSNLLVVDANSLQPLHFLRRSEQQQLSASFQGLSSVWSAPFNIDNIGRIYLRMYQHDVGYVLLKIDIVLENATLYLHIAKADKNWPFSIRNFTNHTFKFYQANPYVDDGGVELPHHPKFTPVLYQIPPKSVMPYAWDYPAAPLKELVLNANGKERRIQLAEIGNLQPMKVLSTSNQPGGIVDLNVVADGPTQTLVMSDYDPSMSLYKMNTQMTSSQTSVSHTDNFSIQENEGEIQYSVTVRFEGIGVSLINRRMQELCYMTLRGIEFQYKCSEIYETFSMKMKWMQIDNQLYGAIYPILLFPSVIPQTSKEMDTHPTFSGSITKVRDDSHGVLYLKYATVLLQQLTVEMDEDLLFSLIEFFNSYRTTNDDDNVVLCDTQLEIPEPLSDTSGLDLYFEVLHIQPAQMDLSFVRTERLNSEEKATSDNPFMFFFNVLTMALGNINDAPVRLNALVIENVRTPMPLLMQSITTHYRQEFFYQIHKILGSADFLGNPVGLFNNLSSGFMDMFYEPYQGYIMNDRPQEFGIGLAKGGLSFMKKSIFGISDSFSKFTGSISKGLSAATMDRAFQDKRRMKRARNRPKHALYGITSGANSFVDNIASGVTGLALAPVQGATQGGALGFFKGLGKGIVGLPTKTALGFFDLAQSVSEGVRNTTTVFDGNAIESVRPPRFISLEGIVRPYNQREAQGQAWLKVANNGEFFRDNYLAHLSLAEDDMIIIVTYLRIMLLGTTAMTTEWEIRFRDLQTIAMERTGLTLILRGGVQGPFIPIPDPSSRKFLYKEIGVAVTEFNRKYQTLS